MQAKPKTNIINLAKKIKRIWEYLYAATIYVDIEDFLIFTGATRSRVLLKNQVHEDLQISIQLGRHLKDLNSYSLSELCELTEEISHFLHVVWHGINQKNTTIQRLEIAGEIDKFMVARWMTPMNSVEDIDKLYIQMFESNKIKYLNEKYESYSRQAASYLRKSKLVHAKPHICRKVLSRKLRAASPLSTRSTEFLLLEVN